MPSNDTIWPAIATGGFLMLAAVVGYVGTRFTAKEKAKTDETSVKLTSQQSLTDDVMLLFKSGQEELHHIKDDFTRQQGELNKLFQLNNEQAAKIAVLEAKYEISEERRKKAEEDFLTAQVIIKSNQEKLAQLQDEARTKSMEYQQEVTRLQAETVELRGKCAAIEAEYRTYRMGVEGIGSAEQKTPAASP